MSFGALVNRVVGKKVKYVAPRVVLCGNDFLAYGEDGSVTSSAVTLALICFCYDTLKATFVNAMKMNFIHGKLEREFSLSVYATFLSKGKETFWFVSK